MLDQFSGLGQYGLSVSVVALVVLGMLRRLLRWGPDVDKLIAEKDDRFSDMEKERDEYRSQVQARQSVVDQALELAALVREFSPRRSGTP